MNTKTILSLTAVVAYCSIVYQLLYAQLLTIMFGGAVTNYSLTIGFFLVSLGLGSFFFDKVQYKKDRDFFILEWVLSIVGIVGVLFLYFLQIVVVTEYPLLVRILSFIPVIAVGFLSGIELPLLENLIKSKKRSYGYVLAADYGGSLIGTILFAFVLYPIFGILTTVMITAGLNIVAATVASSFMKDKLYLVASIIGLIILMSAMPMVPEFQESIVGEFRAISIFYDDVYYPVPISNYDVLETQITPYQDILLVNISLGPEWAQPIMNYTCLYLDSSMQVCDTFVREYHGGMVDYPLQFLGTNLSVLLIGGGDWIGINYLDRDEVSSITHVELDKEFADYAKTSPYLMQYHNNSFESEKLTTIYTDGFQFALQDESTYDMIILDLPGLEDEKLSSLYTVEFYTALNNRLADDGVLVTWAYSPWNFPIHKQTYENTLAFSGFSFKHDYIAFWLGIDFCLPDEHFLLLSKQPLEHSFIESEYLDQVNQWYSDYEFKPLVFNESIRPHSIFKPNPDIFPRNNMEIISVSFDEFC